MKSLALVAVSVLALSNRLQAEDLTYDYRCQDTHSRSGFVLNLSQETPPVWDVKLEKVSHHKPLSAIYHWFGSSEMARPGHSMTEYSASFYQKPEAGEAMVEKLPKEIRVEFLQTHKKDDLLYVLLKVADGHGGSRYYKMDCATR
jgi:hypothetical protein